MPARLCNLLRRLGSQLGRSLFQQGERVALAIGEERHPFLDLCVVHEDDVRSLEALDPAPAELVPRGFNVVDAKVQDRTRLPFRVVRAMEVQAGSIEVEERQVAKCIEMAETERLAIEPFRTGGVPDVKRDLPEGAEAEALRILREFDGSADVQSLSPAGTTAAAVYLAARACGEPRSQDAVARVSGISEVTLRNRYKAVWRIVRREPPEGSAEPGRADAPAPPVGGGAPSRAMGKARRTVANREATFGRSDPGS